MESFTFNDLILQDLQRDINLEQIIEPIKPYTFEMSYDQKIKQTYRALLKARRVKNRLLILINAFFLGQLLDDEDVSPAQRTLQSQTMTAHYYLCSTRVFHLFENSGAKQILNTQFITLTWIRKLKSIEYQNLLSQTMKTNTIAF